MKELITIITIIKNGYEVDLQSLGLKCLDFIVESLSPKHTYSTVQGADGIANIDTVYSGRAILAKFYLAAESNDEYLMYRDEIYKLFKHRDTLTIIDNRQAHKRWNVQVSAPFTIDNELSASKGVFDLELISKTIYATGELYQETFAPTNHKFIVFNDGDFEVEGTQHHLVIKFNGASNKLRIRNNYNNTQWQYLGGTTESDELELERVYPYKNSKDIYEDTNGGYLILERGSNEIQVFGATGDYTVTIEFMPLYI